MSWLPGRHLDRNSAITAMVLADATAHGDVTRRAPVLAHIEGWAAELGLTAPDALTQISSPPGRAGPARRHAGRPEAAG